MVTYNSNPLNVDPVNVIENVFKTRTLRPLFVIFGGISQIEGNHFSIEFNDEDNKKEKIEPELKLDLTNAERDGKGRLKDLTIPRIVKSSSPPWHNILDYIKFLCSEECQIPWIPCIHIDFGETNYITIHFMESEYFPERGVEVMAKFEELTNINDLLFKIEERKTDHHNIWLKIKRE